MNISFKTLILFAFITFALTAVFFVDVKGESFLYVHDEFLLLTPEESSTTFFVRDPNDLGVANTTVMIVTLFDRVFYSASNLLGIGFFFSQRLFYLLKVFCLIFLPYVGFRRLSVVFLGSKEGKKTFISPCLLISLWYSFNTCTLIFWHGNAFSYTLLVCYALAPLAFYYFHRAVFEGDNFIDKLKAILVLFLMSFAIYLFVVFLLLLLFYTILNVLVKRINVVTVLKSVITLGFLYLPLISIHVLILCDMYNSVGSTVNLVGGETYGLLQGGLLYPLLMWFSWGIYTNPHPQNMFTFSAYLESFLALSAPIALYGLMIVGVIKKKSSYLLIFIAILAVFLLFVKGAQAPFGKVYLYLIDNFYAFRIFRSPDNKFGFGITFLLSLILLIVSKVYKKKLFSLLLVSIILIQGYPIFTGMAVRGENTENSSDRIVSVGKDYKDLVYFINQNSKPYGYIMAFPPLGFSYYNVDENEKYLGPDLLPKLTQLPFIYLSEYSGMSLDTYDILVDALDKNDLTVLDTFPIRYFLIRYDLVSEAADPLLEDILSNKFDLVFENDSFKLFENNKFSSMLQVGNIEFEIVSPVKYHIKFRDVDASKDLYFYQSFHKSWNLYLKPVGTGLNRFEDISYVLKPSLFEDTHETYLGYANAWRISPDYIRDNFDQTFYSTNEDGSINFELVLFFKTQSIFYIGVTISMVFICIFSCLLIYAQFKHKPSL